MIPIFTSHYSILHSTLTLESSSEIKPIESTSILSIAKTHSLSELYICEQNSFAGFPEAYQNCQKENIKLRYGLKFVICENIDNKDEESLKTEHKIIIWALNTKGIKRLQLIYSRAATDGFYYVPRLDLQILKEMWTDDLMLWVPHYDSFIYNNLFYLDRKVIPDFSFTAPVFCVEKLHNLPFDKILIEKITDYAKSGFYDLIDTHSIYYYKEEDFYAYMCLRCVENRSTMNKPNLEHMSSNRFSFETYLNHVKTI